MSEAPVIPVTLILSGVVEGPLLGRELKHFARKHVPHDDALDLVPTHQGKEY